MFRRARDLVGRLFVCRQEPRYPVAFPSSSVRPRGRVLFSYLEQPLLWPEDDERFGGHSNYWESREIARIFHTLGYTVDAINWTDHEFASTKPYDVLFDICINLQRLSSLLDSSTIKILHCTGSDPYYQNRAETQRVEALRQRRGGSYRAKRCLARPDLARQAVQIADVCSLLGNQHTLSTYPEELRHKFELVPVSGSDLGTSVKSEKDYVPPEREFLWFAGAGAVHKGLDLLLDLFAARPELKLHVVGYAGQEQDFLAIYRRELTQLPNIRFHGPLAPRGRPFKDILRRVFCFIAPFCSEGISPAVVTCAQAGLFPIVSRDTGMSLPAGCGMVLETCSTDEIGKAVCTAHRMPSAEITSQIKVIQEYALREFSRANFRRVMERFLMRALARQKAAS